MNHTYFPGQYEFEPLEDETPSLSTKQVFPKSINPNINIVTFMLNLRETATHYNNNNNNNNHVNLSPFSAPLDIRSIITDDDFLKKNGLYPVPYRSG